jgi:hypothetical protein
MARVAAVRGSRINPSIIRCAVICVAGIVFSGRQDGGNNPPLAQTNSGLNSPLFTL